MKRGDLVTVSVKGDFGKPRPAVVIQSDWVVDTESVLICQLTGELRDAPIFRLTVPPAPANNLKKVSQVMVDKIFAIRRDKCSPPFGSLGKAELIAFNRMLSLMVGLAD